MLDFTQQYNAAFSMYLTYSKKDTNKIKNVYHGHQSLQKYSEIWPISKYNGYTINKFNITVMYIIYKYNTNSIYDIISKLQDIEFNEVEVFYNNILNYSHNIQIDVNYLISKYGKPSGQQVLQEYISKNINFYTCWWYLKFSNELEKYQNSNIYKNILFKIQFLLLYIKFKESSLEKIKTILVQSDILHT